jgi:hypothetical protein
LNDLVKREMHKFKDLKVYQKALLLTKLVRSTTKNFGSNSKKEFRQFLNYSIRSGFECLGCLDIAKENGFVSNESNKELSNAVNEIIAMLDGLQKSLK